VIYCSEDSCWKEDKSFEGLELCKRQPNMEMHFFLAKEKLVLEQDPMGFYVNRGTAEFAMKTKTTLHFFSSAIARLMRRNACH
jgi:hypothetical protein